MLNTALKAIFGSRNDRLLKEYRRKVESINALEKDLEKLSDAQLQAKTPELREKVAKGATPKAIYDCLRLEHSGFAGSLSAIKRLYARLRGAKEVEAKDITIPVISAAGEIAQVRFRLRRQALRP